MKITMILLLVTVVKTELVMIVTMLVMKALDMLVKISSAVDVDSCLEHNRRQRQ